MAVDVFSGRRNWHKHTSGLIHSTQRTNFIFSSGVRIWQQHDFVRRHAMLRSQTIYEGQEGQMLSGVSENETRKRNEKRRRRERISIVHRHLSQKVFSDTVDANRFQSASGSSNALAFIYVLTTTTVCASICLVRWTEKKNKRKERDRDRERERERAAEKKSLYSTTKQVL